MHPQRLTVEIAIALAMALAACGSPQTAATGSTATAQTATPSTSTATATTSSATPQIVGEWQRTTTCEERVAAFTKAGLAKYAAESVAGDGFIPGVTSTEELKDPKHPCTGAVSPKHSHFFTADGQFGSRDDQGQQVDDGPYKLVGSNAIQIGSGDHSVTFRYTITDGTTLRLTPVMPACAAQGCFDAQWAVAVSYLGLPWTRIGP
jgi:hypothetical protein